VAIIFGIGMALLLAFLLWTFAMVFSPSPGPMASMIAGDAIPL